MHWRRKWQPTPVFLPGVSHGQRATVHGVAKSQTWLSVTSNFQLLIDKRALFTDCSQFSDPSPTSSILDIVTLPSSSRGTDILQTDADGNSLSCYLRRSASNFILSSESRLPAPYLSCSFTSSFTHEIFIKYLLHARDCERWYWWNGDLMRCLHYY